MFKKLVAYYLPFDAGLDFQLPWIWSNAKQYAYRNAIACLALAAIAFTAEAYHLTVAAMASQALAVMTTFFATVFTAAALDPRVR